MDILHVSLERIIFENIRKIGVTPNQKKFLILRLFRGAKVIKTGKRHLKRFEIFYENIKI